MDVDSSDIRRFLTEYTIDPANSAMPPSLLLGYIQAQNARGRILKWNVVVVTRSKFVPALGSIDFGFESEIPLVNRARFERGRDPALADIKALMSEIDPALDFDLTSAELRTRQRADLLKLRDVEMPDTPLLLLYPISKNSFPLGRDPNRRPLEAVVDVLGIGLVFPSPEEDTPQSYMAVSLEGVVEHAEAGDLPDEDE
jgi:hypothetical protein